MATPGSDWWGGGTETKVILDKAVTLGEYVKIFGTLHVQNVFVQKV